MTISQQQGNSYNWYLENRDKLANMADTVASCYQRMGLKEQYHIGLEMRDTIMRDTFKVMVMGVFSAGKSTFINALLREQILPSYATPTTATIAEIKWGEEKKAVLHPRQEGKAPFEVRIEDLESYIVIEDVGAEETEIVNPYSRVELYWPLPILQNNVEIIDSPGLDDHAIREEVSTNYLSYVDAVIFLFFATHFGPNPRETEVIYNLRRLGHEEIFFVINRWDELHSERDRTKVADHANGKILPLTARKDQPVSFISAFKALEGRKRGDDALVEESGIRQLEEALERFLANDRARIKLLRAARELKGVISEIRRTTIPEQRAMLEMPLEELEMNYQKADKRMRDLEREAEMIVRRARRFRDDTAQITQDKVHSYLSGLVKKVGEWLDAYTIELQEKFTPRKTTKKIEEHIKGKLNEDIQRWSEGEFQGFLTKRMRDLIEELEPSTSMFEHNVEQARFDITGYSALGQAEQRELDVGPRNSVERTLAAAGGFFLGGPAMAVQGAAFGYKGMVQAIVPQLVGAFAAALIGLPFLPVAAVIAAVHGIVQASEQEKKIKQKVAENFQSELYKMRGEYADKVSRHVNRGLKEFEEQLQKGLYVKINSVREQVESALEKKRTGHQTTENALKQLRAIQEELEIVDSEVFTLISELAVR
jgi:GTPase SAR1 family protein